MSDAFAAATVSDAFAATAMSDAFAADPHDDRGRLSIPPSLGVVQRHRVFMWHRLLAIVVPRVSRFVAVVVQPISRSFVVAV
jgi:hypothetical protein